MSKNQQENKSKNEPPDVFLVTEDGQEIACHKSILSRQSDYFGAMFASDFVEKSQKYITIKDVDGLALRMLIDLAYGYPLDWNVDVALNLLEPSSMLQLTTIQDTCSEVLKLEMDQKSVIDILIVSDRLGLTELKQQATSFFLHNFDIIAGEKDQFQKLPQDLLASIISHPHLRCKDESHVAVCIDAWASRRITKDPSVFDDVVLLFQNVRFGLLSPDQLEFIFGLDCVQGSECLRDWIQLLIWMRTDSKKVSICRCHCHHSLNAADSPCSSCISHSKVSTEPPTEEVEKLCCKPLSCCFRFGSAKSSNSDSFTDKETSDRDQVWRSPETVRLIESWLNSTARTSPSVPCVVAHVESSFSLQLVDGLMRKKPKQNEGPMLLTYDFDTNAFRQLVRLSKIHEGPVEASGYKVCAIGANVYIFGGEYMLGYSNWQNSVWKYDAFRHSWSVETSLASPRRHHSVCVVDQMVYVIGGFGKHRVILDTMESYDTINQTWKRCANLPAPLYSSACCFYGGLLYLFSNQVFTYDPQRDQWQTVTLANAQVLHNETVFSHAMAVPDRGIYLTGSHSNNLYLLDVSMTSSPELNLIGQFQNVVPNSCFVESHKCIVSFSSKYPDMDLPDQDAATHLVEVYNVETQSFSIPWKQSSQESHIRDFGSRNSPGCFSLLHY